MHNVATFGEAAAAEFPNPNNRPPRKATLRQPYTSIRGLMNTPEKQPGPSIVG
jgi:hypothetical protein